MEKEFFKPLIGWENKYHIGSYGTIKSIGRNIGNHSGYFKPENIRKVLPDKDGYFEINLPLNNRHTKRFHIHRLVALNFISKIPKNAMVCHIDGNRQNNFYKNLYIGDYISNTIDRYKQGRTKISIEDISEIKSMAGTMPQWKIAEKFGIKQSYVSRIINGVRCNLNYQQSELILETS